MRTVHSNEEVALHEDVEATGYRGHPADSSVPRKAALSGSAGRPLGPMGDTRRR
jgi:hypothetical protein